MIKILSSQIAGSVDIKSFKATYHAELIFSDSDELFYKTGPASYIYLFRYGVVAFSNPLDSQVISFIGSVSPFCNNFFNYELTEEFIVETDAPENKFGYNKIELMKITPEM